MEKRTPQEVAEQLRNFFSREHFYPPITSPPWSDFLKVWGGKGLGEVRNPTDWDGLPRGKALRVVYLVDEEGPVVRWVDPTNTEVLAVIAARIQRARGRQSESLEEPSRRLPADEYHLSCEHIRRGDKGKGEVREGYIQIANDGQLFVT